MYWILRRTGATNFFNSLNNNGSTSKTNTNINNNNERSIKRPERKAYGRLSVDSDDLITLQTNINSLTPSDNEFNITTTKMKKSKTLQNAHNIFEENNRNLKESGITLDLNSNSNGPASAWKNQNKKENKNVNLLEKNNMKRKEINTKYQNNITKSETQIILENDGKCISRLQPIVAMPDDDDYDEALTCNVCDRAFQSTNQLASHQQKKRHFGCSECDSLFTSLMLLEHHKDEFEHWSDFDESQIPCCRQNRTDDYGDTDSFVSDAASEDLERLL